MSHLKGAAFSSKLSGFWPFPRIAKHSVWRIHCVLIIEYCQCHVEYYQSKIYNMSYIHIIVCTFVRPLSHWLFAAFVYLALMWSQLASPHNPSLFGDGTNIIPGADLRYHSHLSKCQETGAKFLELLVKPPNPAEKLCWSNRKTSSFCLWWKENTCLEAAGWMDDDKEQ